MMDANPDPAGRKRRRQEYVRQWHAANRDKVREHKRKYREANRDKIREQGQQYREANRDTLNERNRQQREADPGYFRRYREANLDRIREQQREHYQANRQERLQSVRAYNRGPDFDVMWAAMWDAQQGCCYLCERPMVPAGAFMDHWHGCAGHGGPKRSCRYCRRGLAHPGCNSLIGFAGEDPATLRIIAGNLERANADIAARQAVMPQHIPLF